MDYKQKRAARREMLGSAQVARGCRKYETDEATAKAWDDAARKQLFRLNGMAGNW